MQRICNFHRQNGPTLFILQRDPLETRGFLRSIQNRKLKSRFEGFAETRSNSDATRNYGPVRVFQRFARFRVSATNHEFEEQSSATKVKSDPVEMKVKRSVGFVVSSANEKARKFCVKYQDITIKD